jgi:hypothetical protein
VPRLLRGHADLNVLVRHVLEQVRQIHLLHVVASEGHARLLADDSHHGPVIQFSVVEPVQKVNGPGAGGGHAHPHLVGELGVSSGREGRQFLMGRLNELDAVLYLVEGAEHRVDAVAGITVDAFHAPLVEALQHESRHVLSHKQILLP